MAKTRRFFCFHGQSAPPFAFCPDRDCDFEALYESHPNLSSARCFPLELSFSNQSNCVSQFNAVAELAHCIRDDVLRVQPCLDHVNRKCSLINNTNTYCSIYDKTGSASGLCLNAECHEWALAISSSGWYPPYYYYDTVRETKPVIDATNQNSNTSSPEDTKPATNSSRLTSLHRVECSIPYYYTYARGVEAGSGTGASDPQNKQGLAEVDVMTDGVAASIPLAGSFVSALLVAIVNVIVR
jgi:hypothetical protein